jgi:uncharacterized membrane protein YidH (DUF202 family)
MQDDELAPQSSDALRRTQFAEERTLLAWWRTGIATAEVALAVGGILPKLANVERYRALALGVAHGILALAFIVGGSLRDSVLRKALESGSFSKVPVCTGTLITVYTSALVIATLSRCSNFKLGTS